MLNCNVKAWHALLGHRAVQHAQHDASACISPGAPAVTPDTPCIYHPQLCQLLRIASTCEFTTLELLLIRLLDSKRNIDSSYSAGRERRWDAVQAHESVAAMLHNSQLDAFIVVRQFRPAIYAVRWRAAKAAGLPEPPPAAGAHRRRYLLLLLPAGNTENSALCLHLRLCMHAEGPDAACSLALEYSCCLNG